MTDVVEVARYSSEFAAQTALVHLKSEGINASLVTDNAGGAFPSLTMLSGGVRLVVLKSDVEAAQAVLAVNEDDNAEA